MKTTITMLLVSLILAFIQIRALILSEYNFEKYYTQAWELADKASTIPAKQKHIAEFVSSLEKGNKDGDFSKHNAVWLKTPNNSFEKNLEALKTLAERLTEIQKMNPNSFEYNTAIQQIAAQEQGEAGAMIGVFKGCYKLSNYPIVWGWIGVTIILIIIVLGAILLFIAMEHLGL